MTRSLPPALKIAAVLAAALVLLPGCSSGGAVPATSASTSAGASLSTREQALADSLESVRLYSQTYVDLFVDPSMPIDALHEVAVDPALAKDMQSAAQFRGEGWTNKPGAKVTIEDGVLKSADLSGKNPKVVVWVCRDTTSVKTSDPEGEQTAGNRQFLEFRLLKTGLRTPGGWAVSQYGPTAGRKQPLPC